MKNTNALVLSTIMMLSETMFFNHFNARTEEVIEPPVEVAFTQSTEEIAEPEPVIDTRTGATYMSVNDAINIDLTLPTKITADEIDALLNGTSLANTGKDFIEAETTYGVNARYLVSHAILESGWGKSNMSIKKNNLFGFMAYDKNTDNAMSFSSKRDCIMHVASYISREYLNETGAHYSGKNLKAMNIKYASDKEWAYKIGSIMTKFNKIQ